MRTDRLAAAPRRFARGHRWGARRIIIIRPSTRADYVIGCMRRMATREALLKCSCAIHTIAALMLYSHYEQAETAAAVGSEVASVCSATRRRSKPSEELRRAQAGAKVQCR
jgi:hypothetical protein